MTRFGGRPYWDGQWWRCTECNGLYRESRCQTCGATPCPWKYIKLSDADVLAIRASRATGVALASQHGVSTTHISMIRRGLRRATTATGGIRAA